MAGERRGATPANTKNKQNLNNSKVGVEPRAHIKAQTIKLGLDVHADTIVVVRIVDHSAPQPAQKFTPAKFSQWIKTQLAQAEKVYSCYEAGPFGYGLHRELIGLGLQNLVVRSPCAWTNATPGVNLGDKSDAKELQAQSGWIVMWKVATPTRWPPCVCPRRWKNRSGLASRQRESS